MLYIYSWDDFVEKTGGHSDAKFPPRMLNSSRHVIPPGLVQYNLTCKRPRIHRDPKLSEMPVESCGKHHQMYGFYSCKVGFV